MPARPNRWRGSQTGTIAYLAVAGVALLYFLHRLHANVPGLPPFWDARVYVRALQDWRHGIDPYVAASPSPTGVTLPFVSPPLFLYGMGLLSHLLPGRFGVGCYLSLAFVSTLLLPGLLAKYYIRSHWMSAALCLFVFFFQPEKHGSQALLTGNISNVLYAALLAAGVPGLKRNHWLPFYITIIVAGLMKPTFLAFLVLPLLSGEGQWRQCVGAVGTVLVGNVAQWATMSKYWLEFQHNVFLRVFVQGDAGFGLLGQFRAAGDYFPPLHQLNSSAEALLVIGLLFFLLLLLRNRRFGGVSERLWIPCLVVFAVLSNPRILDYDADVAVVPAVYIVGEFCRTLPSKPWRSLQIGVPLTLFMGLLASNPNAAFCLLLVISVLLVSTQLLWPDYFRNANGMAAAHGARTRRVDD